MAKRSQRRRGRAPKELGKRQLIAKNKNKFCNKKNKQFSILKRCKDCGVGRYVQPADAHHVKYCFEHRDLHERERRKLAMRARRAKARKTTRKVRTTRKAA